MRANKAYLKIGKYCRKPQDILRVENYCEPIVDIETWNITTKALERNKH